MSAPPARLPLADAELDARLAAERPAWRREDGKIVRDVELADFLGAVAFVERVAALAERADHHPDVLIYRYRHVRLMLRTHSAGGVTGADLALAAEIDALL